MSNPNKSLRRHHRLSLICVNDVYSFDDLDSSAAIPRGGWSRAATLMKQLAQKNNDSGSGSCVEENESESSSRDDNDDDDETTILKIVNGDVLGGLSLLQNTEGSVAIDVMNSIPIDVAVLGNHEFDYGDQVLMDRIRESKFVWLGSNVYYPRLSEGDSNSNNGLNGGNSMLQERVVEPQRDADGHTHDRYHFPGIQGNGQIYTLSNNLKLGIFGLVTKVTPTISHPSDKVTFDPAILTVGRRVARSLRAQGAQVIVTITHMSEAEDVQLAEDGIAGVDLILGGHEHEPLAKMVHRNEDPDENDAGPPGDGGDEKCNEGGVLVFKCGMNAYWVGEVNLDIEAECSEDGTSRVTSISTSWSMHAVTSRTAKEDPDVLEIVKRARKETEEGAIVSAFGKETASTISLDDSLATIGNADTPAALPLDTRMSSVRRREATGGNLIADAMHWLLKSNILKGSFCSRDVGCGLQMFHDKWSSHPTLAMINGGFIRGDRLYEPGFTLTMREVLKELPFPRAMKVLEIDGKSLKEAMAQQLSHRTPSGAYPHLSSNARVCYERNASSGEAAISSFKVDGLEVSNEQTYLIAVTCFVAEGNEGCTSWLKGTCVQNSAWDEKNISYVLLKFLQNELVIYPALEDRVMIQG